MTEPTEQTTEHSLRLIELLLGKPEGLSPQDLLIDLDISRSSLFLLLRRLKDLGYIEQAEKRGRYRIGPRLQAWQNAESPASQDLLTAFYQEVSNTTCSETLAIALPSKEGPFIIAQSEGKCQVRSVLNTGQVYPDLISASKILEKQPAANIQTDGYCLEEDEETIQLALPVCRDGIRPEAALVLSAPSYRWQGNNLLDNFLSEIRSMAAHLSYRLGAISYTPFQKTQDRTLAPTSSLTPEEISSFLQGPWAARLACIRPDGRPHVIPVWQEWDGHLFHVVVWQGSQWAEYLLQNPNVSLTIDEHWSPLRRVVARGTASLINQEDTSLFLENLIRRMAQRYLGQAPEGLLSQVESAFSIKPEHMRGWQGIPGAMEQKE